MPGMFPGSVTIPRVHKFDELFSDVNVHVLAAFAGQVTKVKKIKKEDMSLRPDLEQMA